MGLDDLPRRREPEAGAALLRGVEGPKHLGKRLLVHSRPGVDQFQHDAQPLRPGADHELAAVFHRLHRVDQQVQHRRAERLAIEPDVGQLWIQVPHHLDAGVAGPRGEEIEQLHDLRVEAPRLHRQFFLPGKIEEVTQQLLQSVALVPHELDLGLGPAIPLLGRRLRVAALEILGEQFHVEPDRGKRVADLVGQGTHERHELRVRLRPRAGRLVIRRHGRPSLGVNVDCLVTTRSGRSRPVPPTRASRPSG